ncbi:MAG: arginine--tRNA ligase, partial [Burkholderiales bacterium]
MDDPKDILRRILEHGVRAVAPEAQGVEIHLERPKNPAHGDYASNVALQLSKQLGRKPREIAQQIIDATQESFRDGVFSPPEIAGAGFLNVRLKPAAKLQAVHRVLAEGRDYGRGRPVRPESLQIEFVSANPTGPLHVGHGRGAAYGASLASLLEFAGHRVA